MELHRLIQRLVVPVLLLCLLVSNGCAVQRSKAPQIDAKTAYALNLESQVTQADKDYIQFFTDVGNANRAGQLTPGDVASLNKVGSHLKIALDEANRLTKAYASSYDQGTAGQVGTLLAQVAADLVTLSTSLAQMKGGVHQ